MSVKLQEYHAPVWNEPVVMEMGHPGRRGILFAQVEAPIQERVDDAI